MGIVGLPNVGKSTFFNILCKMNVAAENYPFCTIDPNLSRVVVPDERFDFLVSAFKTKSAIPAVLTVTDIAGLVKGAAEGAGLGNAFLSHIGAVDGIYHVCRAFESDDIVHVEGSVEPTRDLDIIHNELRKKDMAALASKMEPLRKQAERGGAANKEAKEAFTMLSKFWAWLEEGKDIRLGDWSPAEVEELNTHMFLSAKPVIYLVNMSEKAYIAKKSKFLPALGDWLKARGTDDKMIPFSCEFEGKVRRRRRRRRGSGGGAGAAREKARARGKAASAAPNKRPPPPPHAARRHERGRSRRLLRVGGRQVGAAAHHQDGLLGAGPRALLYGQRQRGARVERQEGHARAQGRRRHPRRL